MSTAPSNEKLYRELEALRMDIDEIDTEIVQLLCERFDTVLSLGEVKRALALPLVNEAREAEVLDAIRSEAVEVYSKQVVQLFKSIITSSKALQRGELNLYFIGMPNCGKTRLAGRIGEILMMPSVDTDTLVMERSGKSIDRIFDEDGEEAFRELEHDVLRTLAYRGGTVVATGGGVITRQENLALLKASGFTVFLDRSIENLKRAKVKNRPLLRSGEDAVSKLYNERIGLYRSAADLTVDPDAKGTVRAILKGFKNALR